MPNRRDEPLVQPGFDRPRVGTAVGIELRQVGVVLRQLLAEIIIVTIVELWILGFILWWLIPLWRRRAQRQTACRIPATANWPAARARPQIPALAPPPSASMRKRPPMRPWHSASTPTPALSRRWPSALAPPRANRAA